MFVVGLTGGIATGKSTVVEMFSNLGAHVIDSDQIAREVVQPGSPGLDAVIEEFGTTILNDDGTLNRAGLAGIIFTDDEARHKLNAIIHPLVRKEINVRLENLRQSQRPDLVIVDVPLLYESEFDDLVDATVVVYCPENLQLARLMKRNKLTVAQARARIEAQLPIEAKTEKADYIIDNSGSITHTEDQVKRLWERWQHENRINCT